MFIRVAGEPVQGVALRSCTVPRPSMAGGPVAAGSTACHGAHMSHVTAPAFLATNGLVEVLAHAWCADAAGAAGTLAGPIGVGLAVDTTAPAARAGSLAAGNEALQELQHLGTDHTAFMMHPPGYLASLVGLLNRGYQALKDRVVTVPTETTESPVVEEA